MVTETKDLGLTKQDVLFLSRNKKLRNSNITEAEVMANIVKDPILIGVSRSGQHQLLRELEVKFSSQLLSGGLTGVD